MKQKVATNTTFLLASTIFVSKEEYFITTILGSCVAVCLYDPVLQIGGMNHYMMPLWNGDGLPTPKYGNVAIEKLIKSLERKGAVKERMIAKLFGGANQHQSSFEVGKKNVKIAYDLLEKNNIKLAAKHVEGEFGRKIIFNTKTGKVMMKLISKHY